MVWIASMTKPIARYMEETGLPATSSCQNAALRLPLFLDFETAVRRSLS